MLGREGAPVQTWHLRACKYARIRNREQLVNIHPIAILLALLEEALAVLRHFECPAD